MKDYDVSELNSLRCTWENYFSMERDEGKEIRRLIYGIDPIYSAEEKRARQENNIKSLEVNFLYKPFRTVVNQLAKNYYSVDFAEQDEDVEYAATSLITERCIKESEAQLNKGIEQLVSDGHCSLIIVPSNSKKIPVSIMHLNDSYEPFFDKYSLDDNMTTGSYCGYKITESYESFIDKYGYQAAQREKGVGTQAQEKIESIEVYHIWIRSDDKIDKYIYTATQVLKKEPWPHPLLPMIWVPVIMERDTRNIKLEMLGRITKKSQLVANDINNYILSSFASHQYKYLAETNAVGREEQKNYADPGMALLRYIASNAMDPKSSQPEIIPPINPSKEAMDLLNELTSSIASIYSTSIDVTMASKYDSLAVLTEKQREADKGTAVNKLSHSWNMGMRCVLKGILSVAGATEKMLENVIIQDIPDIMRHKALKIEMLFNGMKTSNSELLNTELMALILEIDDPIGNAKSIALFTEYLKLLGYQMQSNMNKSDPAQTRAEAEMAVAARRGEDQKEVTILQGEYQIQTKKMELFEKRMEIARKDELEAMRAEREAGEE